MARKKFSTIQEYIQSSPKETRVILRKIKALIQKQIPGAEAGIAYNMPAFKNPKPFIYFAAFKKHIGVYPPVRKKTLQKKLKPFMNEKGNLRFSLDEEIPYQLIGTVAVALKKQYEA